MMQGQAGLDAFSLVHLFFSTSSNPQNPPEIGSKFDCSVVPIFFLSVESKFFFLVSPPKPQCFSHHHNILPFVDADMRPLRMPWFFPIASQKLGREKTPHVERFPT